MRFTLPKKRLIAAVKAVLPAVPTRPGLPVLAGVRIDAGGNLLSLKATDLEVAIEEFVATDASVEEAGAAIVPAKRLLKALQAMAEDDVVLAASAPEEGRLTVDVIAGNRTVTLDAYPAEDWPEFPSHAETTSVATVEASPLADALTRAALCASTDEARPILTAVALSFDEGSDALEVVATDSYRLGLIRIPLAAPPVALERPLLVPARAAKSLAKRLKGEREVRILTEPDPTGGGSRAVFSFGRADWWVRTIEGEFPNWRQVMPEPEGGCLEFDASELESALKAASAVRESGSAPVRLALDRECALTLSEPDLGTVREELAGARFSPDGVGPLEVAFNPEYLADGIRFAGEERGRLWVRDGLKPALFEGPGRSYAVMPVRTR
ncbi:MAG: DNA polymerase III subunit beta [Actinomycetota bacterium]